MDLVGWWIWFGVDLVRMLGCWDVGMLGCWDVGMLKGLAIVILSVQDRSQFIVILIAIALSNEAF